jgi:hypothetical protein
MQAGRCNMGGNNDVDKLDCTLICRGAVAVTSASLRDVCGDINLHIETGPTLLAEKL